MFDSGNAFWQGVSRAGDLVWLNVLFLVATLPVVTGGAAFTALFDVTIRFNRRDSPPVNRTFWVAFRSNFKQASLIWLVIGPIGVAVAAAWLLLPLEEVLPLKALTTLVFLTVFPYFFFLQAKFENSVGATIKNALLIPMLRLPYSLTSLAIQVVLVGIAVATTIYVPQALPILALLGFGGGAYAITPALQKSVEPWDTKPQP